MKATSPFPNGVSALQRLLVLYWIQESVRTSTERFAEQPTDIAVLDSRLVESLYWLWMDSARLVAVIDSRG